jgi:hypothetical protein
VHEHDAVSVYLVLGGRLREQAGQERAQRTAGDLVFTPLGAPHSDVFERGGGRCFIVDIQPQIVARVVEYGELPSGIASFRGPAAWLAARLYREFRPENALSALTLECPTLELLASICREPPHQLDGGSKSRVSQACDFIDAHLGESVSLADVARAVSVHPRLFGETRSEAPWLYRWRIRAPSKGRNGLLETCQVARDSCRHCDRLRLL